MAYIEREAYSKALKDLISDSDGRTNYEKGYIRGLATANGILLDENQTPAADVVEVVRCKDCAYYKNGLCMCGEKETSYATDLFQKPDDYCSYGERKDRE